ncbi:MAG: GFA family protein [Deltaproteobacteria bacterium]|nr:GFA family protein [Deltaproteobacteria bacterium]MBW2395172.1 GFA family protein [Deltaproteobacteria bacterium]
MTSLYQGECFCGAVKIEVSGEPVSMAYCHCDSCRSWSGSPVHASTMWMTDSVKVVAGKEHLQTFQKTPQSISHRQYCAQCGGHLMIHHPDFGMFDVFAATLPTLKFVPSLHVNYSETVLPMPDGLPKFRDLPSEFGGSGELTPE